VCTHGLSLQLYQSPTKRKRYFSGGRLYVETELFEPGLRNIPAGQEVRQPSVLLLDFHDFEFVINKELNTGFAYYAFIIFYSPNLLTYVRSTRAWLTLSCHAPMPRSDATLMINNLPTLHES